MLNPLFQVVLFWFFVALVALAFSIACIRWGFYTAGNHEYQVTLEA